MQQVQLFPDLEKNEKRLDSSVNVRYLFAPGELEDGPKRGFFREELIGTLRSDDGDGNENATKQ